MHGPLKLLLLMGLLPLASARHAEFLHNKVPGIMLTNAVLDRMRLAGDEGRREGIKIAQELLELQDIAAGAYLMPPFGRFDTAAEVFAVVRQKTCQVLGTSQAFLLPLFQEANGVHHFIGSDRVQQSEYAAEQLAAFQLSRDNQATMGPACVKPLGGQIDESASVFVKCQNRSLLICRISPLRFII